MKTGDIAFFSPSVTADMVSESLTTEWAGLALGLSPTSDWASIFAVTSSRKSAPTKASLELRLQAKTQAQLFETPPKSGSLNWRLNFFSNRPFPRFGFATYSCHQLLLVGGIGFLVPSTGSVYMITFFSHFLFFLFGPSSSSSIPSSFCNIHPISVKCSRSAATSSSLHHSEY